MKYVILLTLVCASLSFSQQIFTGGAVQGNHIFDQTAFYTKASYTNTQTDTTGWFTVEPFRELAALITSSDSGVADVYFDARNSFQINTNAYTTYQDSLKLADSVAGGANSGEMHITLFKTTTLNRLLQPANNQLRIRVARRSAGNGTTAGRVMRVWLIREN